MTRVRFSVDGNTRRAFERAPDDMEWALERKLDRAAQELAREQRRAVAKAESTTVNSIRVDNVGRLVRFAGAHVQSAVFLERGTEGGGRFPPVQSIEDWVRVAGITPVDPGWDQRDLAWAIARSIQQQGTPPQPFIEPTFRAYRRRFGELMRQGVREGVAAAGRRA